MAIPTYLDRRPVTGLTRTSRKQRMPAPTSLNLRTPTLPAGRPAPAPVGTAVQPSPSVINPVQAKTTGLARTAPGRNAGGSITMNGQTTNYAPSAYNPGPNRPNMGGTITKDGVTTNYAPSPAGRVASAAPTGVLPNPAANPAPAAPKPPQQTEAVNPLTNSGSAPMDQLEGTTEDVDTDQAQPDPAQSMGFSQRGSTIPAGTDAAPQPNTHTAGTGLYAKTFNNPRSAKLYENYVRKLFGNSSGDATGSDDDA